MTEDYIPVRSWAEKRMKDPQFKAAYDALEGEFALASALIDARARADLTQQEAQANARHG